MWMLSSLQQIKTKTAASTTRSSTSCSGTLEAPVCKLLCTSVAASAAVKASGVALSLPFGRSLTCSQCRGSVCRPACETGQHVFAPD